MPRSLHARARHSQRAKRRIGVFVGMTYFPAPWWPDLLAQVTQIATEAGIIEGFEPDSWLLDVLRTPSPALDGRTPLSLMDTDAGVAQVKELLGRLQRESQT